MREILFRGKRVDNGEWEESPCHLGTMCSGTVLHDFDPATVGQYTGLTDKNEKKIFEGDIVHLVHDWNDGTYETWDAVVEFGNPNCTYSWGWQLRWIRGEDHFNKDILLWVDMEETGATCEVIGKIHEAQELLWEG